MLDAIGWVATGVFSISYFVREPAAMLRVQAAAACLWIAYGLSIGSTPVVAANAIVAVSAVYSAFVRSRRVTS
ncbi:MAG TPA: hypothetical protein VMZ52_02945 [Bryobacteraceae bacterium]|nr:hypothetical protein [Bryobacteraceae bacterium]